MQIKTRINKRLFVHNQDSQRVIENYELNFYKEKIRVSIIFFCSRKRGEEDAGAFEIQATTFSFSTCCYYKLAMH